MQDTEYLLQTLYHLPSPPPLLPSPPPPPLLPYDWPSTVLPTTMSSDCLAAGLKYLQMSMVNSVLELLKIEVSELMRAANTAANMMPLIPGKQQANKEK